MHQNISLDNIIILHVSCIIYYTHVMYNYYSLQYIPWHMVGIHQILTK